MQNARSGGSVIKEFFEALTKQERVFAARIAADSLGLILRSSINELDWFSYNLARGPEVTFDQEEQFYLLHIGVTRLIKLALKGRASFDVPTVMFRRSRSISIPALEIATGLGMIEHGRRIAQMAMTGLGHVERTDTDEFLITLPAVLPDEEYYERAVTEHFHALASGELQKLLRSDDGLATASKISELLTELVYPFMDHFIGYEGDPALDTYFFGIASHVLRAKEGYDSFNYAALFGGVTFHKYILGLTFLVSLAIRHERFAEALVAKEPAISLENVLTISADLSSFIDDMRDAINFFGSFFEGFEEATTQEARTIFDVLSVGRDNADVIDRPGSPLPLLIRTSDNDCIRCQSAVLANPMQYLLDSLRNRFPRDYDANQRGREGAMQLAIRRVLGGVFAGLLYHDNLRIRKDGRTLTDIDVVVLEPATGVVLLIQLKHQDIYGMDIHSRYLRGERLRRQVERWLGIVGEWIDRSRNSEIRRALKIPGDFPEPVIHRVVVTRHFGYPIADIARAADVAFATWDQFYNAILLVRQDHENPSLADLITTLRAGECPGGQKHHNAVPRTEWVINELKFITRQAEPAAG